MASDVPDKFSGDYYDEKYFADKIGKSYKKADGTLTHWGYMNPTGEASGCPQIIEAWKKMFQPKTMLDIGCGRGTLVAYARNGGIEAYGFDFSKWGLSDEGRYARCKPEWVKVHNATEPFPYPSNSFDLVTALDLLEHIYLPELPAVIDEIYRVSKKWVFLQTAVAGSGGLQGRDEEGYILEKGKPVPVEFEGCAVAGHVTLRKENWWYEKLERDDWMPRKDMVQYFIGLVDSGIIHNWLLNSMIIMERLE